MFLVFAQVSLQGGDFYTGFLTYEDSQTLRRWLMSLMTPDTESISFMEVPTAVGKSPANFELRSGKWLKTTICLTRSKKVSDKEFRDNASNVAVMDAIKSCYIQITDNMQHKVVRFNSGGAPILVPTIQDYSMSNITRTYPASMLQMAKVKSDHRYSEDSADFPYAETEDDIGRYHADYNNMRARSRPSIAGVQSRYFYMGQQASYLPIQSYGSPFTPKSASTNVTFVPRSPNQASLLRSPIRAPTSPATPTRRTTVLIVPTTKGRGDAHVTSSDAKALPPPEAATAAPPPPVGPAAPRRRKAEDDPWGDKNRKEPAKTKVQERPKTKEKPNNTRSIIQGPPTKKPKAAKITFGSQDFSKTPATREVDQTSPHPSAGSTPATAIREAPPPPAIFQPETNKPVKKRFSSFASKIAQETKKTVLTAPSMTGQQPYPLANASSFSYETQQSLRAALHRIQSSSNTPPGSPDNPLMIDEDDETTGADLNQDKDGEDETDSALTKSEVTNDHVMSNAFDADKTVDISDEKDVSLDTDNQAGQFNSSDDAMLIGAAAAVDNDSSGEPLIINASQADIDAVVEMEERAEGE